MKYTNNKELFSKEAFCEEMLSFIHTPRGALLNPNQRLAARTDTAGFGDVPSTFDKLLKDPVYYEDFQSRSRVDRVGDPELVTDGVDIRADLSGGNSDSRKKPRTEGPSEIETSVKTALAGTSATPVVGDFAPAPKAPLWSPAFGFCGQFLTVNDSCISDPINSYNLLYHSVLPSDREHYKKKDLASLCGHNFLLISDLIAVNMELNDRITTMVEEKQKSGRADMETKVKKLEDYKEKYLMEIKTHSDSVKKLKSQLEEEKKSHALALEDARKEHAEAVESLKQGFANDKGNALLALEDRLGREKIEAFTAKDAAWKEKVPAMVKYQVDRIMAKRSGKADSVATHQ